MYDITLHRLRIFKCVVEHGGIRAAATVLGISQPSVSEHVRCIETVIGQPLLDRRPGKSGLLTDAGHIVYSYAHDVIIGADSVNALLRDLSAGRRGTVSFAATRTLGSSLLGPVLTEFYRSSPGVLVSAHTGTLADVSEMVLTGAVGFGLVLTSEPLRGLESELLRLEPIVLVVGRSHPLAARERIESGDLSGEPLFVSLRSSVNFRSSMAALRAYGLSYQHVALETDDYVTLKGVIACGSGIAVLPRAAVEREIERDELVALPVSFTVPPFELLLAHLPRHRFTPSEAKLMQLMRTHLGDREGVLSGRGRR